MKFFDALGKTFVSDPLRLFTGCPPAAIPYVTLLVVGSIFAPLVTVGAVTAGLFLQFMLNLCLPEGKSLAPTLG